MIGRQEALQRWADDEFVVGHHLGSLMHAHLDLEEAIAMGSLSQDELSHCSLVCELLGDADEAAKDRRLMLRDPLEFRCSSLAVMEVESWPDAVAKHLLYEVADAFRVAALAPGTVIRREEELHRHHWWAWAEVLAQRPVGRTALRESIERLWPATGDLLDMGIEAAPSLWLEALHRGFEPLGVSLPVQPAAPARRGQYAPDAEGAIRDTIVRAQSVYRMDPSAVWA